MLDVRQVADVRKAAVKEQANVAFHAVCGDLLRSVRPALDRGRDLLPVYIYYHGALEIVVFPAADLFESFKRLLGRGLLPVQQSMIL